MFWLSGAMLPAFEMPCIAIHILLIVFIDFWYINKTVEFVYFPFEYFLSENLSVEIIWQRRHD